jgi:Lon protease-like protein
MKEVEERLIVPVFPLPSAVLFPDTILPLHIFEDRYRAMVRDAAAGDKRIAISLLHPGFEEEYEGQPPFHRIGTIGRIEQLEELPNGRYNLHLVGEQRVQFEEIPSPTPYRLVRTERLPETLADAQDAETRSDERLRRAKVDLLASHAFLLHQIAGDESGASLAANDQLPFRAAVNGTCANLPVEAPVRQALLEIDDLFERQKQAQLLINEVLAKVVALKEGDASTDESRLN